MRTLGRQAIVEALRFGLLATAASLCFQVFLRFPQLTAAPQFARVLEISLFMGAICYALNAKTWRNEGFTGLAVLLCVASFALQSFLTVALALTFGMSHLAALAATFVGGTSVYVCLARAAYKKTMRLRKLMNA